MTERCPTCKRAMPRPIPKVRKKPRRGRIRDRARLAWCAGLPCCITGERPVTVHHVRKFGSPKDDTRIIPLVARLHLRGKELPSQPCIERGKAIFERFWHTDIEALVRHYQNRYKIEVLSLAEKERGA